jgi:hypothetical protein
MEEPLEDSNYYESSKLDAKNDEEPKTRAGTEKSAGSTKKRKKSCNIF